MTTKERANVFLKWVTSAPILIIIFLGALLRFTNLNWDSFMAFHPDERNISWAVTRIRFFRQLNPQFFAYGGLPIYLYRALGEIIVWATRDPSWLSDWGKIAVIGRLVSATLSTINIFLIYRVGQLFFAPEVGLVAALFLAFSPWALREGHFATTETMLVFFLLWLLTMAYYRERQAKIATVLKMGAVTGLALGAKTTSLFFALIPLLGIWLTHFPQTFVKINRSKTLLTTNLFFTAILILTSLAVFFLISPYTLLDRSHFLESMRYETGVVWGKFTVPYTLQFLGTPTYRYQLETMLWQSGPLVIIGLAGMLFLAWQLLITRRTALLLFLIFPLLYGAFSGLWFAKFSRYNIPLLPFLTLAAAVVLVALKKRYLVLGRILLFLAVVTTSGWGLANWTIYLRPQTRIAASRWIYQNIPAGSFILTEHWNDGLPVRLPGEIIPLYKRQLLNVYDPDGPSKIDYYADNLSRADFIILSTRRIWSTMPKLKARYPLTSRFYKLLLASQLGYRQVMRFSAYPKLGNLVISDDDTEETIQVFDHPTVIILENSEKLPASKLKEKLASD